MSEKLKALNAASSSSDFWGNSEPKCPHCGSDYNIERNEAWSLYDDNDSHDVECPRCELPFAVRTIATYSFCTDEQEID